jgi:galactonate dehydratase
MGPISTAVSAHFAASTPNFCILEYRVDSRGPMRSLLLEPFKYEAGYVYVPETPGLGIELNEKAYDGHPLRPWHRPILFERDGNVAFE